MNEEDYVIKPEQIAFWGRIALYLYCASGLFGAFYISDNFEAVRGDVYAYIGIPLIFGFVLLNILTPNWELNLPKLSTCVIATIFLVFSWGNILLINAADSQDPETVRVERNDHAINIVRYRGALGWLYKTNF